MQTVILDGYVDEPAHHGAPPYISTYPRYVAGALVDSGVSKKDITYYTIDEVREDPSKYSDVLNSDLLVVSTGMAVPVNSVGGDYMRYEEMERISSKHGGVSVIGGPVRFGVLHGGGEVSREIPEAFDYKVVEGDLESSVYDLVNNGLEGFNNRSRNLEELEKWAKKGAFIVEQHPNFPDYLIAEVKIGRGCPYSCSFCVEPLYGGPVFRDAESVVSEVESLNDHGLKDFRLQAPNFLTYGGDGVEPNPSEMEKLYKGINSVVEDLRTLHLDNFNAGTVSNFPEKSRECVEIISKYNTPGDTCSLGLETADDVVREENSISVTNEECFDAIKMLNEVGGFRVNGGRSLPKLLPGVNFVFGLKGQSEQTFRKNFEFLKEVYDEGYMLRRINLRQVSTHPGTDMEEIGDSIVRRDKSLFKKWKKKIRREIDRPMLERVAPVGTVIKDVVTEFRDGGKTFGRTLGSYPLLIGMNNGYGIGERFDVCITDYGYRSVTGVKHPLNPNEASMSEMKGVPGVGAKRAANIVVNRPYKNYRDFSESFDFVDGTFFKY